MPKRLAAAAILLPLLLTGCVSGASPFLYLDRYEVEALLIGRSERGALFVAGEDRPGDPGVPYTINYLEGSRLTYTVGGQSGDGVYGFDGDALCRSFDGCPVFCSRIAKTTADGYVAVRRTVKLLGRHPSPPERESRATRVRRPFLGGISHRFTVHPPTSNSPITPPPAYFEARSPANCPLR